MKPVKGIQLFHWIVLIGILTYFVPFPILGNDEVKTSQDSTNSQSGSQAENQVQPSSRPQSQTKKKILSVTNPALMDVDCLANEAAIEDLRKGRAENEAKAKELASKEADLKVREQALTLEIHKLEDLRDEISKTQDVQKKAHAEKVAKLVETFLTMSPKAAAKILSTLDDDLAVDAMTQMDTQRLAKIMNLIEPARSSQLSELMAGVVRAKTSPPLETEGTASRGAAGTTSLSEKGGEKK